MEQTNQTETTTQAVAPIRSTSALMTTLMALVENYIKDIVQAQVIEIMTNHQAMRVIDDGFEKKIRDIAQEVVDDAISTHNDDEDHISEDAITDIATSALEDHDFDDKINEAVNDAINEFDFEDIVRTAIKDNITFSVSVD
jgi:hypothetical protein